jgi:hypothetical protein
LEEFDVSSTHAPVQSVRPAPVHLHVPPLHCVPEGHTFDAAAVLQAPQLLLSVEVSVQVPAHAV